MLSIGVAADLVHDQFGLFLENRPLNLPSSVSSNSGDMFEVRPGGDGTMCLMRSGHFLHADATKPDVESQVSGEGMRSDFVLVHEDDLWTLQEFFGSDWVLKRWRQRVRSHECRLDNDFILKLGPLSIDLRYNLPFQVQSYGDDSKKTPLAVTVFTEGWRLEEIFAYRPLIYFTAYSNSIIFAQLALCVQSIIEVGKYDGRFHFISDKSHDDFATLLPFLAAHRFTVQHVAAQEWVGFVASKYALLEWDPGSLYQPILFLDTDIVCDAPLEVMLCTIAISDVICAPREEFSALATAVSVGSKLFHDDNHDTRGIHGFNGGTIGIPSVGRHIRELSAIRQVILNYARVTYRGSLQWVDQEIANYVLFKTSRVDIHALVQYVRWGHKNADAERSVRRGLVHFWPCHALDDKLTEMQKFWSRLVEAG